MRWVWSNRCDTRFRHGFKGAGKKGHTGMALKKLNLSIQTGKRPVDPLEVFNKLKLRGSIKNIWEPQAEALRKWDKARDKSDVVVQMNTGGGKTLVGLLIAQSLANEKRGRVLYVCPNNQLVEQTLSKANEISLTPALRYRGGWTNREGFDSGDVFCVTNYAAVFHGHATRTTLANEDVQGVVFDDAHVAEDAIRGQFTLRIPRGHGAHETILGLLRKHFANSAQAHRFQDICDGRPATLLFVPMFVVWHQADAIRKALLSAGVDKDDKTLYAWEHLRDHLNHCTVLLDRNGIEVTPSVVPLSQLPIFGAGVRRVYLTATLPSQASFARTFGIASPTVIEPSGKSGDAQRLFVFASGEDDESQRDEAKALVAGRKCCVISPSARKGEEWVPPATIYDKDDGQGEIDRFAKSTNPEMLCLAARYDGIDLPGDACRILVLDRLPFGEAMIDRFIDESIRIETMRTSHTATRIVQAIGRIFRSNTDHGVVVLVGPELQAWLRNPNHAGYLPPLLQHQMLLGCELAKQVDEGQVTWRELIEGLLTEEENWDEMYNKYIDQFETRVSSPGVDWYISLVHGERLAYENLWRGQYQRAADEYGALCEQAAGHDPRLAAWYHHWRGAALMCADDRHGALHEFVLAANVRTELGRPNEKRDIAFKPATPAVVGQQAKKLAALYRTKKPQLTSALSRIDSALQYGPETAKAEEALWQLGALLGLEAERPDQAKKTGPDVLWIGEGEPKAWGFELKTNKTTSKEYSKDDITQCHDHERFLEGRYKKAAQQAIVGPMLPVSEKAHPSPELLVIELDPLRGVFDRIKAVFESVDAGDKANLEQAFQAWLEYHGLLWPACVEALDSRLAADLRKND